MVHCVDLRANFSHEYQVRTDHSNGSLHDPWQLMIPCRFGHIYPHGDRLLGVATNGRGPVANRLAALRCVRIVLDGDDGINVVFDVGDFDSVAQVMQPKRRRRLSAEKRAERAERLRNYQFSRATHDAGENRRRVGKAPADISVVHP